MAKKQRDYRAEYARRNALAKQRGFTSYSAQRRSIEKGSVPAIDPTRLRSRNTIEAQEKSFGIFGRQSVKDIRISAASDWSERNARTNRMKFDESRARTDEDYLSTYLGATIMQEHGPGEDSSTIRHNNDLEHLLVDILGIMDKDEYDSRYGIGGQ